MEANRFRSGAKAFSGCLRIPKGSLKTIVHITNTLSAGKLAKLSRRIISQKSLIYARSLSPSRIAA